MLERAREHVISGDAWNDAYLHFDGSSAHDLIPDEFWNHIEAILGMEVPRERRATQFSCSC